MKLSRRCHPGCRSLAHSPDDAPRSSVSLRQVRRSGGGGAVSVAGFAHRLAAIACGCRTRADHARTVGGLGQLARRHAGEAPWPSVPARHRLREPTCSPASGPLPWGTSWTPPEASPHGTTTGATGAARRGPRIGEDRMRRRWGPTSGSRSSGTQDDQEPDHLASTPAAAAACTDPGGSVSTPSRRLTERRRRPRAAGGRLDHYGERGRPEGNESMQLTAVVSERQRPDRQRPVANPRDGLTYHPTSGTHPEP